MDHEELELAPSTLQTGRLRPWLALAPAVIGIALAVILAIPGGPPRPYLSPVSQCSSMQAIATVPVCESHVEAELARQLGTTGAFAGRAREVFAEHEDMMQSAREGVIARAERARASHVEAMQWWEVQSEAVQARRWQALWPAGVGGLLSLLLGGVLWWRRPRSHRVRLSAHHLEIDGRRLPLAELDEIVLDDVIGHERTLRVRTAAGEALTVRLPAFEASTDRLEQLLDERVPALEDRRRERQDGARIRAEARALKER